MEDPATSAAKGTDILKDDDLAQVLRELLKAKNKAYELGLELKLPQYEVESIRDTHQDPQERFTRIIEKFLKQVSPEPTWRVIVDALRSPLVNHAQLARKIEEAHFAGPIITRDASTNVTTEETSATSSQSAKQRSSGMQGTTSEVSVLKKPGSPVPNQMTVEYVEKKIKQFERRFNKQLKWATRDCLKKRGISVEKVVDALADLPADDVPEHKQFLESQLNILYQASDLIELFGSLSYNVNYLSYHLVEHLILEFELELKSELEAYKEDLRQFRTKTPLKLFHQTQKKRHIEPPSKFEKVVAKFEWPENHDDITLEDVEKFRQEYAYSYGLRDCAMMLSEIFPNCFVVSWLVPVSVVTKLRMNVPTNIFREYYITKLTVAGKCLTAREMATSTKHMSVLRARSWSRTDTTFTRSSSLESRFQSPPPNVSSLCVLCGSPRVSSTGSSRASSSSSLESRLQSPSSHVSSIQLQNFVGTNKSLVPRLMTKKALTCVVIPPTCSNIRNTGAMLLSCCDLLSNINPEVKDRAYHGTIWFLDKHHQKGVVTELKFYPVNGEGTSCNLEVEVHRDYMTSLIPSLEITVSVVELSNEFTRNYSLENILVCKRFILPKLEFSAYFHNFLDHQQLLQVSSEFIAILVTLELSI